MSLGAFLAGVLLSSSEYRHELQADIAPFEGLLLGFFFLSVGMSVQLDLLAAHPGGILADAACLIAIKAALCYGLGHAAGHGHADAVRFALALPQGSEFSFVLFGAAVAAGSLGRPVADRATLVIALSMAATPVLFAATERWLLPRLRALAPEQAFDPLPDQPAPVIICGFGRMGQIVGRVLRSLSIPYTALEQDASQIEAIRRFGSKVYYGDPARPDLLRAAGAETARLLVVTLADPDEVLRVVDMARRTFPGLRIAARARNRRHAHLLMERNVSIIVRETFHSALQLTGQVLDALGLPAERAAGVIETFRRSDEQALLDTVGIRDDENRLIQSARQMNDELAALFEHDRKAV